MKTNVKSKKRATESPSVAANNKAREIVLLQQRSVLQVLDRLKLCAHRCQYSSQQPIDEMRRILAALETHFNKLVDMTLAREMQVY